MIRWQLWQRIGCAGGEPSIRAVSVVHVGTRFILPSSGGSGEFDGFTKEVLPGSDNGNPQAIRELIKDIYSGTKVNGGPPILVAQQR